MNTERSKFFREYFEDGCICLNGWPKDKTPKTLEACPPDMPDTEAIKFYEQNCKCTRNYINLAPEGFEE